MLSAEDAMARARVEFVCVECLIGRARANLLTKHNGFDFENNRHTNSDRPLLVAFKNSKKLRRWRLQQSFERDAQVNHSRGKSHNIIIHHTSSDFLLSIRIEIPLPP